MNKARMIGMITLLIMLLAAYSVMALDTVSLRQNMWRWASLETKISGGLDFDFGNNQDPMISTEEAYQALDEVRQKVSLIVASIKTEKEMQEARVVAKEFSAMFNKHAEVGKALGKLLDMQEKYLSAHGN